MKIRSITYFDTLRWPFDDVQIQDAGEFIKMHAVPIKIRDLRFQTTRLASAPFPYILQAKVANEFVGFAVALEDQMLRSGFDYASIGPAIPSVKERLPGNPRSISEYSKYFHRWHHIFRRNWH